MGNILLTGTHVCSMLVGEAERVRILEADFMVLRATGGSSSACAPLPVPLT